MGLARTHRPYLGGGREEGCGRSRGDRAGHGMHILKYLVDLGGFMELHIFGSSAPS